MKNDRNLQIQDIVSVYTNRFTCASMCDTTEQEERECAAANTWLKAQIAANGITKEELKEAFDACEKRAKSQGNAFSYDTDMLK